MRKNDRDFLPWKIFVPIMLAIFLFILFILYSSGLILNFGRHIYGEAMFTDMAAIIDQKEGKVIKVIFDNQSPSEKNIGGWGASQQACLTTTQGEYWCDFGKSITIPAHSKKTITLYFKNFQGNALNLKFVEIQILSNGLPTDQHGTSLCIPIKYDEIEG